MIVVAVTRRLVCRILKSRTLQLASPSISWPDRRGPDENTIVGREMALHLSAPEVARHGGTQS